MVKGTHYFSPDLLIEDFNKLFCPLILVLVIFLTDGTKYLVRSNLKKEMFLLSHSMKVLSPGGKIMAAPERQLGV